MVPGEAVPSFADVAGRSGDVVDRAQGQSRVRLGSQGGQKRSRNDNEETQFQPVQNRRRRPANHGSSQVEVEDEGANVVFLWTGGRTDFRICRTLFV